MNICIVSQQLRNVVSGIGLYSNILVNFLSNEGHSITVIVPKSQRPQGKFPYKIFTVNDSKIFKSQARWLSLSIQFSRVIKELEKTNDFDLIHFTDVRDSFFCKTKSPKIGNINDTYPAELHHMNYYRKNYLDWFQRWIYYRLMHSIEERKLHDLDCIIANSHYTFQTIKNQYQVSSSKLVMCYKSVDINRYNDLIEARKNDYFKMENDLSILFVGGNMQRKGLLNLIETASRLSKAWPTLKFLIVGKDKFIPRYMKICEQQGVGSNFHFLGWVPQDKLIDLYRNATIFVMPSLTEALGIVFLEAMASGVPVIATNVGGITEIIKNKNNGLLVPVNSPEKLALAIRSLITNPRLIHSIILNASETVKKFSIERMMKCTEYVYSNYV